jgi:hypothetical protein
VRKAAMISISRAMSRDGFTGGRLAAAGETDRNKARCGFPWKMSLDWQKRKQFS